MKPYQINIINATILVVLGAWGYLGSASPSPTSLIPVAFGVLFFALTPWFRKDNKVVAHVVVLLTFVLLFALAMPLKGSAARGNQEAVIRLSIMMISCTIAMFFYIKSFRDARKARELEAAMKK